MPSPNGSLILKGQAEIEVAPFFPDFDLPEIDKEKPKFHCTGDRLFRDRPDIYKAVVRLLADPGVTIRTICQECHVTDDVVRSVKARENIPIALQKKNILSSITHGLRLCSERVIEVATTASPRDALIGVGILAEKMELLSGGVTARIEITPVNLHGNFDRMHQEATNALEEYRASMAGGMNEEEARLLLRVKGAKALVDYKARQTGLNGENFEQKALTNGAAAVVSSGTSAVAIRREPENDDGGASAHQDGQE